MDYARDEVLFTAFPLFHVNAKYTTVLPALYVGGEVVMRAALQRLAASGTSAAPKA